MLAIVHQRCEPQVYRLVGVTEDQGALGERDHGGDGRAIAVSGASGMGWRGGSGITPVATMSV